MATLLAKLFDPFDLCNKELHCLILSNNGENMDSCEEPHATDIRWSMDSYMEMELKLKSLRLLICDLLKTNQELRAALVEARSAVPNNGSYSSKL